MNQLKSLSAIAVVFGFGSFLVASGCEAEAERTPAAAGDSVVQAIARGEIRLPNCGGPVVACEKECVDGWAECKELIPYPACEQYEDGHYECTCEASQGETWWKQCHD
jgi:hypothetical protein